MTHMTKDSGMNGLFVGIILIALGAVVFGNSLIGSGISLGGIIILIASLFRMKGSNQQKH